MKTHYILIPIITIFMFITISFISEIRLKDWYSKLKLPQIVPKRMTFVGVWVTALVSAAAAVLLAWNSLSLMESDQAILIFLLTLNILMYIFWSFLFFYMRMLGYAVIDVIALAVSIFGLVLFMFPISTLAALLLVPYFVWGVFLTYFTFSVWQLNK